MRPPCIPRPPHRRAGRPATGGHRFAPRALAALAALAVALLGIAVPSRSAAVAEEDAPAKAATRVTESWYLVTVDGQPAGWSLERVSTDADGHLVTVGEERMRFARGTAAVEIESRSRFVETAAGEPVSMELVQDLGSGPVTTRHRFLGDGRVERVGGRGETARREVVPAPEGDWLTPAAARREIERLHRTGAEHYALRLLSPDQGLAPVLLERRLLEREVEGPHGARGDLWREEASEAPGMIARSLVDGSGQLLSTSMRLFGMEVVMRRVDRQTALGLGSGEGTAERVPPELLVASFLRPDRPIPSPRRLGRATYELRLSAEAGRRLPRLPETTAQRVERVEPDGDGGRGTVRVTVDARPTGAAEESQQGEGDDGEIPVPDRYLASSQVVAHDDPALAPLMEEGLAGLASDAPATERAEALRRFVHRYVEEKSFDQVFATASQVARSRAGDCTEHGVLLAALLRAVGIPSRVATGVVYVDEIASQRGVFGYHLWTQAYLDGRWIDLDPSFPDPFDATHIAFDLAALGDDEPLTGAFGNLALAMGDLEIRVIELAVP